MPKVTALRADRRGRVHVELDGVEWRTLSAEVVVRSQLRAGLELDRAALRVIRRELRRSEALAIATRALANRDASSHRLRARLEQRGVSPELSEATVATLETAGLVDDERFACSRAAVLAERGYGDAAIDADLEDHGIPQSLRDSAIGGLGPEVERARAVARRRAPGPRLARHLAARGFDREVVEAACRDAFAPDP